MKAQIRKNQKDWHIYIFWIFSFYPADKDEFISILQQINPNIKLN